MDPTRTVLVASDAHLGSASSEQESAFLTFLEQAPDATRWLILNGDVFDFWFEYFWGTTRGHERALAVLEAVVETGIRVTFMGGNHDWWGGRFLREEIGVEYLQYPIVTEIAGRRTFLGHGDGLGVGDIGFRLMRPVLQSRLTRWAFATLPPIVGDRIARGVSRTDDRWGPPGEATFRSQRRLRAWAAEYLRTHPDVETVLLGHCHIPSAEEVHEGQWYLNSGDWVHHRSYIVLEEGRDPRIAHWEGAIE